MKEKNKKLLVRILALVMAAFMCVGTAYYLFALFGAV